jgi:hypothetical protein
MPATSRFGTRFVDIEVASAKIETIQGGDGSVGFSRVGHLDECKTPRPAGIPIGHDAHTFHCSVLLE